MRKPTHADAELLLRLYEIRREPELRRARAWLLTEFQPEQWEQIKAGYLSHTEPDRWFRMATAYWEMVGTLVRQGVLHEVLFFEHTGEDIPSWNRCKPWIAEMRGIRGPLYLRNFEWLAERHIAYRARLAAATQRPERRARVTRRPRGR